jgi:hypothetical protein
LFQITLEYKDVYLYTYLTYLSSSLSKPVKVQLYPFRAPTSFSVSSEVIENFYPIKMFVVKNRNPN